MSDLIRREAIICVLKLWKDDCGYGYEARNVLQCAMDTIEELPSTEPEIIRCKDCKWCDMGECNHVLGLMVANDNNFCSYAERK